MVQIDPHFQASTDSLPSRRSDWAHNDGVGMMTPRAMVPSTLLGPVPLGGTRGTGPCFRSKVGSQNASSRRKMDQSPSDPSTVTTRFVRVFGAKVALSN